MSFLLSSLPRLSFMSVVFDFNTSLNDVAPVSPILLSVDCIRIGKNEPLIDAICVLFLLSSLSRLRFESVVFDFNASLNDVAPVSPMLFSVDDTQHKTVKLTRLKLVPLLYVVVSDHPN